MTNKSTKPSPADKRLQIILALVSLASIVLSVFIFATAVSDPSLSAKEAQSQGILAVVFFVFALMINEVRNLFRCL